MDYVAPGYFGVIPHTRKPATDSYYMYLTDIPDQSAIVRQYMRHTAQLGSAKTIEQGVKRALQMCVFATGLFSLNLPCVRIIL